MNTALKKDLEAMEEEDREAWHKVPRIDFQDPRFLLNRIYSRLPKVLKALGLSMEAEDSRYPMMARHMAYIYLGLYDELWDDFAEFMFQRNRLYSAQARMDQDRRQREWDRESRQIERLLLEIREHCGIEGPVPDIRTAREMIK